MHQPAVITDLLAREVRCKYSAARYLGTCSRRMYRPQVEIQRASRAARVPSRVL